MWGSGSCTMKMQIKDSPCTCVLRGGSEARQVNVGSSRLTARDSSERAKLTTKQMVKNGLVHLVSLIIMKNWSRHIPSSDAVTVPVLACTDQLASKWKIPRRDSLSSMVQAYSCNSKHGHARSPQACSRTLWIVSVPAI